MIKWPPALISDLARRRAVVVLGAGISRNSTNVAGQRPALWNDFLQDACTGLEVSQAYKKCILQLIRTGDNLTACEMIKKSIGNTGFHEFVRQKFLTPGFGPAPIHDSIIRLDSRIVATPNIDTIYENRVNALQHNSVLVKAYYDDDIAEAIRLPGRLVLKVHGTVNTPSKMIFTRSEYAMARHRYRGFYAILEALAATHTFLFLGCGMQDPDIRLLLEDYAFRNEWAAPHYFVLPKNAVKKHTIHAIEDSMNIKILTYDPCESHKLLGEAVIKLGDAIEEKRALLTVAEW